MPTTVLTGGQVLDPDAGTLTPADVTIADGRFVAAGAPPEDTVDVSGLTLVPGLIDCHSHCAFGAASALDGDMLPTYRLLGAVAPLRRTLELGVTTVRDAWGADAGLRDAIEAGLVDGPRLLVSLAQLTGTGGIGDHFHPVNGVDTSMLGSAWLPRGVFDGPDQARGAVRRMVRSGADVIKVAMGGSATMPATVDARMVADDEIAAIVAAAEDHGRHVMAHAHGARGAESAARAGVRSIEHGWFLDEAAVEAMAEAGTWLVPTLLPVHGHQEADRPSWMAAALEASARSVGWAREAGVPIAMGTDCPMVPHEERLGELAVMRSLGMGAAEVWRAATSEAARLLDRDDLGRIDEGRRADLVAVSGDPWSFEGLADRVVHVWKDGRQVR